MIVLKDLNLIPKAVVVKKSYEKLLRVTIVGISIVLVISIVVDLGMYIYKWSYDNKVNMQENTISNMIGSQTDSDIQRIIESKISYKNKVYDKLKERSIKVRNILDSIEKVIPIDVSIEKFEITEKGEVTLLGQADTEESVLDFFYSLKKSGLTDFVKFDGLDGKFGDDKGFKFSFKFQLKGIGSDNVETK